MGRILAAGLLAAQHQGGEQSGGDEADAAKQALAWVREAGGKAVVQDKALAVDLTGCKIENADLARLKALSALRVLKLDKTPVSLAGVKHLAALTQLEQLSLRSTPVTDSAVKHLAGL